jgi:LacI family transcriptional regulator
MAVSMKDVARLTGVSINTVSRALKDMPDISAQTKRRVRQTAMALGYTPNLLARGLVLKRSFNIGMIATELTNPSRSTVIDRLRHLALEQGYQLLVSGYETEAELAAGIRDMTARGVDGLVIGNLSGIIAERSFWPALEAAQSAGTPVAVFFEAVTEKLDSVFVDYARLTEQLTTHLIECHGLERVCFLGVTLDYRRGAGYLGAMRAAGLEARARLVPVLGWTMAAARQGIIDFLRSEARPQALVCHNELAAIGAMAGRRDMNVHVPRDVAVVGLDDVELAEYVTPSLTTVGMDPGEVAARLFQLLHARIEGRFSGGIRQVTLPARLRFRESCGCGTAGVAPAGPAVTGKSET